MIKNGISRYRLCVQGGGVDPVLSVQPPVKLESEVQGAGSCMELAFYGSLRSFQLNMIEAYFPPCRTGGPVGTFDAQQRPVQTL